MRGYTIAEVIVAIFIICIVAFPFVVVGLLVSNCDSIAQTAGKLAGEAEKGYNKAKKED